MKYISFRVTVMTLFVFLAILIISFMNFMQLQANRSFSENIMNDNFGMISSRVKNSLKNIDTENTFFIDTVTASMKELKTIETILKDKTSYISILSNILLKNNSLYSAYFAFKDDSFFEIINLNIDKGLRKQYKLTNNARWLFDLY